MNEIDKILKKHLTYDFIEDNYSTSESGVTELKSALIRYFKSLPSMQMEQDDQEIGTMTNFVRNELRTQILEELEQSLKENT